MPKFCLPCEKRVAFWLYNKFDFADFILLRKQFLASFLIFDSWIILAQFEI